MERMKLAPRLTLRTAMPHTCTGCAVGLLPAMFSGWVVASVILFAVGLTTGIVGVVLDPTATAAKR